MPKDGKKYILIHKDGDLGNCQANNLEWKEVRKYKPTATKRKLDNGLEVKVDGTILDKKKALPIVKEIGDSDTDSMKAIEHPYVSYRRKNKWGNYEDKTADVDDLMAAAEYVDGDKSTMKGQGYFIRTWITRIFMLTILNGWKKAVLSIKSIWKGRKRIWISWRKN